MNKIPTKLCYAICAVLLLCHLSACKDPVITDRSNTLDFQTFNLSHIDTCTVTINTVPDRPLVGSGVSTGVLGSMNDLFFGNTFASVYAQCLLSQSGVSLSGKILDSAVLIMPYVSATSKYGRCDKPVDVVVYELNQDMVPGNTYYSNDAFSVFSQPIGQRLNFVPDLVDSVYHVNPLVSPYVPSQNQSPMLRVRLSNTFATKLMNTPDSISLSSLNFIEYFKGLYITTNPTKVGNGLVFLSLANNNSNINLYYHSSTGSDTSVYQFPISTYGVTLNHFDHYYGGTLVQNALSYPNPNGDKVGYVQAGAGTKLRVRIPYLKNIDSVAGSNGKKLPIGVTKAELIMPILDTLMSDPSYQPPPSLTMYRIDDNDSTQALNYHNYSGVGSLTTRLDNNGKSYLCYVFNLTEYVQRVFNGYYSNNNGYYIGFSYTVRGDRTIILNDPAKISTQCKLKITYTKLQ